MDAVDPRRPSAVAPGQTTIARHCCDEVATRHLSVVRRTGEIEAVSIGLTAVGPVDRVMNLAMVAGLKAIRPSTATVPCVAHNTLVRRCDAFAAAQVQRALRVIV